MTVGVVQLPLLQQEVRLRGRLHVEEGPRLLLLRLLVLLGPLLSGPAGLRC